MSVPQISESSDSSIRIYDLDFRHKVRGIWDESTPIINHIVIEGRGVIASFLDSEKKLRDSCDIFCKKTNLHIVSKHVHKFQPKGKTVFYVLEESHLSIHTWPEKGYLHLDLVTCSKNPKVPLDIIKAFNDSFNATHTRFMKMRY